MRKFVYLVLTITMLFGMVTDFQSVSANENGIVNYNQKNGNNMNSADHVPAANNPSDIHVSHGDSSGFEYKVPGSSTTYYADKNSPLYKQLHDNPDSSSNETGSSHHNGSSNGPISSDKMPKLPSSKSSPKHRKTIVVTKTTKPTKQNKKLLLVHKGIGAIGIGVILFGIIYGIVHLIDSHRKNY